MASKHNSLIRASMRTRRLALSGEEVQEASHKITQKLLAHPFLQEPRCIASYCSFAHEVDSHELNQALLAKGHTLALPLITQKVGHMDFYAVDDYHSLRLNRYGILEPQEQEHNLVNEAHLELIILPLVAFDRSGNRLGMGGGYYDRLLKRVSALTRLIALAYSFQEVNDLEVQAHDMSVHEIITEQEHIIAYTA